MLGFPWDRIVPISGIDQESAEFFSCGDSVMDGWFLDKARTWARSGFCQVYVALAEDEIVGFFSLSPTQLEPSSLAKKMRGGKNSMGHPALLLGRIAVRRDLQGHPEHVGSTLLEHAIRRACESADMVGGRFIVLDSKTDALCDWYARFGFVSLPGNHRRMVLPMKDARQRVAQIGDDRFLF